MYKIVVTTPAGDFTFDKVYSSVSEANEYIETLYKHFDETASFKVVLADLSDIDDVRPLDTGNPIETKHTQHCLLYTSPSPRDGLLSRMPSSA